MMQYEKIDLMPDVHFQSKSSPTTNTQATVFVVDDEPAIRRSLQELFTSEGWQVQVFNDGPSFLDAMPDSRVGCVVLDIKLPGMDGLAVYDEMKNRHLTFPVLFYTGYGTVKSATRAMKQGAVNFLEKSDGPQVLLDSIHDAIGQHHQVVIHQQQVQEIQEMLQSLTPRENEVLSLVMEGQTSREIANQLHRSEKTIQLHRANIMKKFNVNRVVDLINRVMTCSSSFTLEK